MKKKITTVVLLLAFAAIAITGGTLAYFTDTEEATNTFVMGNIAIALDEAKVIKDVSTNEWKSTSERVTSNVYEGVYPGATVPKEPTIKNIGSNSAYVRLKVTVPKNVMHHYHDGFNELIHSSLQSGWSHTDTKEDNDSRTYIVTYANVLGFGQSTSVFTHVAIPVGIDNDEAIAIGTFDMHIIAEAIQADGFTNVTAAFEAFDKQV